VQNKVYKLATECSAFAQAKTWC